MSTGQIAVLPAIADSGNVAVAVTAPCPAVRAGLPATAESGSALLLLRRALPLVSGDGAQAVAVEFGAGRRGLGGGNMSPDRISALPASADTASSGNALPFLRLRSVLPFVAGDLGLAVAVDSGHWVRTVFALEGL